MPVKKTPETIKTKTGVNVTTNYCRKCMQNLPAKDFYECVDEGLIDANGLQSVCKNCIQILYDKFFSDTNSPEKAIQKLCTSLNVRFSNEALSATKAHIDTMLERGKVVTAVFGIYKQKLVATKKSMDKSGLDDMTYVDVNTIYVDKNFTPDEAPIPEEVLDFWGRDFSQGDIKFLESEYANFKKTHVANTYAEKVLLRQVCYSILDIKKARMQNDDATKLVQELQSLMKNLAISPNVINSEKSNAEGDETFGLWIQDIEQMEPAQWLKNDPRGDMYRDVGNIEEYFQKYFVRPLKNFITGSKDFNISDEDDSEEVFEFPEDEETIKEQADTGFEE